MIGPDKEPEAELPSHMTSNMEKDLVMGDWGGVVFLIDLRGGGGGQFFPSCVVKLILSLNVVQLLQRFVCFLSELNSGSKIQLNITEPGSGFTTKFEPENCARAKTRGEGT